MKDFSAAKAFKTERSPHMPLDHDRGRPEERERILRTNSRKGTTVPEVRWDTEDEVALLREFCRFNFWTFFLYAFGAGSNPKGKRWIDNAVHEPMAEWFQHHVLDWHAKRTNGVGEQKHLAIIVHREVGKSTMFTQAGQAWLHVLDPEISTYTGSERLELSQKSIGTIKAVFDGSDPYSMFTKLYGNWSGAARTWTGREIVHAARRNTSRRDPSLGTFAVETSIVGAHPDAIFYDDPISYERLNTDSNWLSTVNSQVSSLIPVIQSDGLVVWVGTRYDDQDHFGVALKNDGVASHTGMPSEAIPAPTDDGKWHVYFMAGRDQENRPSTPKVWSERRLKDYQRTDPLRYASQVMNDPAISEFNPLTKEQIAQCVIDSNQVPWSALRFAITTDIAFWDGESMAAKDDTCFLVHGYPRNGSGDVYVVEGYGSNRWRGEDFCKRLVATVQRYRRQGRKIFAVTGETTRAGAKGTVKALIQNYFHDANEPLNYIEFERGSTKKEIRLVAAANFWVDGHVKIVKDCPGFAEITGQMSKIGAYLVNKRTKIDWADAHADAFQETLYQPMRRFQNQPAPYERGAQPLAVEGLRYEDFDDSDSHNWDYGNPRPPIR